jgi:hypothetical protein
MLLAIDKIRQNRATTGDRVFLGLRACSRSLRGLAEMPQPRRGFHGRAREAAADHSGRASVVSTTYYRYYVVQVPVASSSTSSTRK